MAEKHGFFEGPIEDVKEIKGILYDSQEDGWIYRGQRDKKKD
jgi:hypothetical protein